MDAKLCQTCKFAKEMGYRQIFCENRNEWQSENHSCERWKEDSTCAPRETTTASC